MNLQRQELEQQLFTCLHNLAEAAFDIEQLQRQKEKLDGDIAQARRRLCELGVKKDGLEQALLRGE